MYDFYIETPAQISHLDSRKPLLNKGKAQKPPAPPPVTAPYRASESDNSTQASMAAGRRKGLRASILGMPTGAGTAANAPNLIGKNATLGANTTALGSAPAATSPEAAMSNMTASVPTVASMFNRRR
jgi:hypothetical protein